MKDQKRTKSLLERGNCTGRDMGAAYFTQLEAGGNTRLYAKRNPDIVLVGVYPETKREKKISADSSKENRLANIVILF